MILRRISEVESIDVGKSFGLPERMLMIQWIFSNEVGDDGYHHNFAIRKYTIQPGLALEDIPFHNHRYVQAPYVLSGRMLMENDKHEKYEAGPGDTIIFSEDEPHRGTVVGDKPVEFLCIIDCPGNGADCIPEQPKQIEVK